MLCDEGSKSGGNAGLAYRLWLLGMGYGLCAWGHMRHHQQNASSSLCVHARLPLRTEGTQSRVAITVAVAALSYDPKTKPTDNNLVLNSATKHLPRSPATSPPQLPLLNIPLTDLLRLY